MPDNVINGVGKPRFRIPTEIILSGTSTASSSTSITLVGELDELDIAWGLKDFVVWSLNTESPAEDTEGKIVSWDDATDIITVDAWTNGTPGATVATKIQGKRLDLPYCNRLSESWTPDFIVKKMLSGEIRRNKRGYYYSARLDYTTYLHKDNLELLIDLFDNKFGSFLFYPRADNTSIYYTVDISPSSSMSYHQLKQHQGHGGVIIDITGLGRVSKIPLVDVAIDLTKVESDDDGVYETDDDGIYETED